MILKIIIAVSVFCAALMYLLMKDAAEYEERQCNGDCASCDACGTETDDDH